MRFAQIAPLAEAVPPRSSVSWHRSPRPAGRPAGAEFRAQGLSRVPRTHCPGKGSRGRHPAGPAAGLPLKIAAKVDKVDRAYFESKVEPLIDGHQIELIGEIDEQQKSTFLGNALAWRSEEHTSELQSR